MESFRIGRTLSRAWQLVIGTLPTAGLFLLAVMLLSTGFNYVLDSAFEAPVREIGRAHV